MATPIMVVKFLNVYVKLFFIMVTLQIVYLPRKLGLSTSLGKFNHRYYLLAKGQGND